MRFSYLVPWQNQPSAEKEFSFRLKQAMVNIGHELVLVNEGELEKTEIKNRKERFGEVLLLPHFTIPPKQGMVNIQLLWNSPKTVAEYRYGMTNLAGSDYFLSGGSALVDKYFCDVTKKEIIGEVHPSVDFSPYQSQVKHGSKMFYSGINWERITGNPSRHGDLLRRLDRANLVDIYGPKKLRGINVWDGFINYKGEIEMDGKKLIQAANNYGVSLALLNDQHVKWRLPSIRLPEAFAAKNIVITSDYPFLDFLGDSIFRIPNNISIENQVYFIGEKLNWIWNNLDEAMEMAHQSSHLWFSHNSLERQLSSFISNYNKKSILTKTVIPEVKIKFLNPHSPSYPQDLYISLLSEDYDFLVHSLETLDWVKRNHESIEGIDNYHYFLTMAHCNHGEVQLIHPSLESYTQDGPSYLVGESLFFNFLKLKDLMFTIPFESAGRFFSDLMLSKEAHGLYLPLISCNFKIDERFTLPIAINQPHQITSFGQVHSLEYSPILPIKKMQIRIELLGKISKRLPSSVKDLLRPIWLWLKS